MHTACVSETEVTGRSEVKEKSGEDAVRLGVTGHGRRGSQGGVCYNLRCNKNLFTGNFGNMRREDEEDWEGRPLSVKGISNLVRTEGGMGDVALSWNAITNRRKRWQWSNSQ